MQQGEQQYFRQSDPFTPTIITTTSPASPTTTMTTTSSSNTSSRFSFLNGQYNQLIDDLSIIDDMMVYQEDEEEGIYDNTIADASRVVAKKQQSLEDLQQSEIDYVHSLTTFEDFFASRIQVWFDQNQRSSKSIGNKLQDIQELFRVWGHLLKTHRSFCQSLKERKQMWGPTQLISDVLLDLHTNMIPLYEQFMKRIGKTIVALDQLYRASSFTKIVNVTIADHDMIYFLRLPLQRINVYIFTIERLIESTLPGHPDYRGLKQAAQLFRFEQFQGRLSDCRKHLAVMEIQRTMPNCPATVTLTRRVLLQAPLVKVNLEDPSNTSDIRTYILYNDMLLFCKQSLPSTSNINNNINSNKKLQLKGKLELRGALVRPFLPQLAEEILDSKTGRNKMNILNTFRNNKKTGAMTQQKLPTAIYGFEVLVMEGNADYMAAFHQNYGSSGPAVRRRHVLRAYSAEQQDAWLKNLDHAIQLVNTPTRVIVQ
ncbi:Dbl homology domain-containing protein [Phascolomyces articulosus]|uniref:Dbl homology domain-containing protein n=1 Tax=Phascolomyces articulosus TaxID=60185 RepID=A0AAD5JRN5_9FUNG|nr:Dbl homology domain-containing protein [Phascolomyces articulosus]